MSDEKILNKNLPVKELMSRCNFNLPANDMKALKLLALEKDTTLTELLINAYRKEYAFRLKKQTNVFLKSKQDYVSLTDIVFNYPQGNSLIEKWLTDKNTIEFLSVWEKQNNKDFKYSEFEKIKSQAGTNAFYLSVDDWIFKTNAIGLKVTKEICAHGDIALNFALYLSPEFQLNLIKEFNRIKEIESNQHNKQWDLKRILNKTSLHKK